VKCSLFVAVVLNGTCALAFSQDVDRNKPHARICIAVFNSASGDEEAFQAASTPGKGKRIVAHLDANAKCEAIIAAFNRKSGQLANGWPPQFVQIAEQREVVVPKAPVAWSWEKETGPIELYVLVFAPGSKDGVELKTLVSAMQNLRSDAKAKLQTNKLRELIGRAKFDKARAGNTPTVDSTEVGGVFRMVVGFEWRDSARIVNFSADKPGALVFSE
jgi:hypothetical protein